MIALLALEEAVHEIELGRQLAQPLLFLLMQVRERAYYCRFVDGAPQTISVERQPSDSNCERWVTEGHYFELVRFEKRFGNCLRLSQFRDCAGDDLARFVVVESAQFFE